ncbi:carbohydrate ABC transporter permease [Vallitalea guaymasensis]|uniref:carbohydrate ABC transporter permease n=1 Tax=Vallitalea guaymasensis TaxID=1185412 RepID=UPI000DE4A702|nr:sugar ABC transporter permease [Vallitalea guaymasensis]
MNKRKNIKRSLLKFGFLVPAIFFFGVSMLIPFLLGIQVSFTSWDGISQKMNYIGLQNYANIFSNSDILQPMKNTIYFAILITIFNNAVALGLALILNKKFKGNSKFRLIYFIPTCLSTVLACFVWKFLYREVFYQVFGINSLIGNMKTVIPALVIISLWNGVAINMLIYLSALINVPRNLYEAAKVDGANVFQRFRNVTVPLIGPAFTTCVTLSLTYGLREFSVPMIATGGGPARSSETIAMYIYKHLFEYSKAGYGQAISIVFMVFLLIIGKTVSTIFRKREVEM